MIEDRFWREVRISKEQASVHRQLPHPCRHCSHVNTEGQVHRVFTGLRSFSTAECCHSCPRALVKLIYFNPFLSFFFKNHIIYLFCVCVCLCACIFMFISQHTCGSHRWPWESNIFSFYYVVSGYQTQVNLQAWQPIPLPDESSYWLTLPTRKLWQVRVSIAPNYSPRQLQW